MLTDKYINQIRITTTQSFARLKASPKKIPDIVGIIIDDVVTSSVMFIGPLDRESILNKLLSAVTTPNNNPNKTVKNEIFSFKSNSPNNRTHTEYTIILKRFMCFAVFNAVLQELLKRQFCSTIVVIDVMINTIVPKAFSPFLYQIYHIISPVTLDFSSKNMVKSSKRSDIGCIAVKLQK